MTYEVVMPYHLHMPSYFLGTFTEYPYLHRTGCGEYRTDVSPRIYTLGMTIPAATATAMTTA